MTLGSIAGSVIGKNESVICLSCRQQEHQKCPGGSWCDCQHLKPSQVTEPSVGWIRQG
ncbi:MAG TPA: hypothetical protein VMK13_02290 [Streptosporangiaceae bacterium]|nr:hypothetical protein [Streptosporangiaceae bacterium]